MKKLIALLLSIVMVMSLAACGADESAAKDDEEKKETVQSDSQNNSSVSGEISVENLMNHPASPEEDFEVMALSDTTCSLSAYLGDDEIVVFPKTVQGKKITEISAYCFRNTPTVKAIRLSDSVETIGTATFSFNENIEIVVFGSGVKTLGESAFMQAEGIREVVMNDGLEVIGPNCFQSCSIPKLEIPGTVKEFGQMAFVWSDLQEVVLGDGLTQLGSSAFTGCSQLNAVVVPESLNRINGGAFAMCAALTSIYIPDGVKEIEDGAFQQCSALTGVILPDGLEKIGDSSFTNCTSLTGIEIPASVTVIGENAFSGCTGITTVDIPDSVTEIGEDAFSSCETIIGGAGSCAQTYAIKNGIGFQARGTDSVVGGEDGYVANLPDDLILSVNGNETSLLGKGGVEIMDALGLEYELRSEVYDPSVPQYITYDGNGDGWSDIIVSEKYTDSRNGIYVDYITIGMDEGVSVLGMTSGATIYEAFSVLGEPDDRDLDNQLYTYYWKDVQIGDTLLEKVYIMTFDDTFHELKVRFYSPVEE